MFPVSYSQTCSWLCDDELPIVAWCLNDASYMWLVHIPVFSMTLIISPVKHAWNVVVNYLYMMTFAYICKLVQQVQHSRHLSNIYLNFVAKSYYMCIGLFEFHLLNEIQSWICFATRYKMMCSYWKFLRKSIQDDYHVQAKDKV